MDSGERVCFEAFSHCPLRSDRLSLLRNAYSMIQDFQCPYAEYYGKKAANWVDKS